MEKNLNNQKNILQENQQYDGHNLVFISDKKKIFSENKKNIDLINLIFDKKFTANLIFIFFHIKKLYHPF